jgi:tetratricopeptide (TPR) repeat protein
MSQIDIAIGNLEDAAKLLAEAMSIRDDIHENKPEAAPALWGMATIEWRKSRYQDALPIVKQGLETSRRNLDKMRIYRWLNLLGVIHWRMGDFDEARTVIQEAIDRGSKLQDTVGAALNEINLGHVTLDSDRVDEAEELYLKAQATLLEVGRHESTVDSIRGLAEVALAKHDPQRAKELAMTGLELAEKYEDKDYQGDLHLTLGRAALREEEPEIAQPHFRRALELRQQMDDRRGIAAGLEDWSILALFYGQTQLALRILGAAEALRDELGAPRPPLVDARIKEMVASAGIDLAGSLAQSQLEAGRDEPIDDLLTELFELPIPELED